MSPDAAALESLYTLAQAACEEIQSFQPELVIGLAHSGWLPVQAARALWAEIRPEPFPPTLRLNLGLEKLAIYRDRKKAAGLRDIPWNYASELETGHLLAWVDGQIGWQAELKEMVREVTASQAGPRRVLILDEMIAQGSTFFIALGLIDSAYPRAETRFMAGDETWSHALGKAWLAERAPELLAEISAQSGQGKRLSTAVGRLIVGTEDLAEEQGGAQSLQWRRIGPETPAVRLAAEQLPLAECLGAAGWAEQRAASYLRGRRSGQISEPEDEQRFRWSVRRPRLDPRDLRYRRLWLDGCTTPARWAEICGTGLEAASQELEQLLAEEDLALRHPAEAAFPADRRCYLPCLVSASADEAGRLPLIDVYWALPGSLLAGPSPAAGPPEQLNDRLVWLVETGVTTILDLTEPADRLPAYQPAAEERVSRFGRGVRWISAPLPRFAAPARVEIRAVLTLLSEAVAAGETVYLCDLTGAERAGMVLGCRLVELGWDGWNALQEVDQLRLSGQLAPAFGCPETAPQRDFVLGWGTA